MILETERLVLRPIGTADLDAFMALHADPEVTRYLLALDRPAAAERLHANEVEWEERGHGMFAICDGDGNVLGRAGLHYWPQFDETEIGWVLRREAWGRGYAREAAAACIDWGFESFDLPYLTAMIQPANERSVRVAERLGMTPVRRDRLFEIDVVVHALARAEWERARGPVRG